MPKSADTSRALELRAELLKERIYATLALLAVLISIDPHHTSSLKAAAIVAGTAFSLWIASLVATQMSYRIVMQKASLDKEALDRQYLRHAPLLAAAFFPVFLILLTVTPVLSLAGAINLGIAFSLLLLIAWSLYSAIAMRAGRLATFVIAGIELAIGLGIVGLKLAISH
jgi:hypothetical protein